MARNRLMESVRVLWIAVFFVIGSVIFWATGSPLLGLGLALLAVILIAAGVYRLRRETSR